MFGQDLNLSGWSEDEYLPVSDYSPLQLSYPMHYRVIASIVHVFIFMFGVCGNAIVIVAVTRTRSLQSPTYTYLVSLAYADLIVLLSAVPEAVLVHHIGNQWILGQIACSCFIFANFLGINCGSFSILAFSIEQFVAFCGHKKWMQKFSSHPRAVVCYLWIFTTLYCTPWLFLTEVRDDEEFPHWKQCELRLSRELYLGFFASDFILFYLLPLVTAVVCYAKIARVLMESRYLLRAAGARDSYTDHMLTNGRPAPASGSSDNLGLHGQGKQYRARQQLVLPRTQVLRMLVVVVVVFAVAWLPFRGLLIYNSFAPEPWLDVWFLFFAKTLIFLNSAINPFLYSIMSPRFRFAVRRLCVISQKGKSAAGRTSPRTNQRGQQTQHTSILSAD